MLAEVTFLNTLKRCAAKLDRHNSYTFRQAHMTDDEILIQNFHQMWDAFPGMARLISKKHIILAANDIAIQKGFIPGAICAKVGAPESHKGCLLAKTLKEGQGMTDRPHPSRIRGWLPVSGIDDVVVHFSLNIPDEN